MTIFPTLEFVETDDDKCKVENLLPEKTNFLKTNNNDPAIHITNDLLKAAYLRRHLKGHYSLSSFLFLLLLKTILIFVFLFMVAFIAFKIYEEVAKPNSYAGYTSLCLKRQDQSKLNMMQKIDITKEREYLEAPAFDQYQQSSVLQLFDKRLTIIKISGQTCYIKPMRPGMHPPRDLSDMLNHFLKGDYTPDVTFIREHWYIQKPAFNRAQLQNNYGHAVARMCGRVPTYMLVSRTDYIDIAETKMRQEDAFQVVSRIFQGCGDASMETKCRSGTFSVSDSRGCIVPGKCYSAVQVARRNLDISPKGVICAQLRTCPLNCPLVVSDQGCKVCQCAPQRFGRRQPYRLISRRSASNGAVAMRQEYGTNCPEVASINSGFTVSDDANLMEGIILHSC